MRPVSTIARVLEVFSSGVFFVFGAVALGHGRIGAGLFFVAFALVAFACFELRFWAHRRELAQVRALHGEVGRRDVDGDSTR